MELENMYREYVNYVKRFKKMLEALNELASDKSIDGFQIRQSDRTVETVVFTFKYEGNTTTGTMTLKEIFTFLEEEGYSDDLIKQGVCDLILKNAKNMFISNLFQR